MYFPFVELLAELAAALVLGVGSVMVANGSLTPGSLIAFLLYLDLFFAPIQQLSQVFDSYQQARVSLVRIGELLATPTTVPRSRWTAWCPNTCGARSSCEDVHFKYATRCRRSVARPRPAHRCRARPSRSSARRARASRR